MDLKIFISSLNKQEKEELFNMLKEPGQKTSIPKVLRAVSLPSRLIRVLYNLYYSGIEYIEDVTQKDFLRIRNAGMKTYEEFQDKYAQMVEQVKISQTNKN